MMNLSIDEQLLDEAWRIGGKETKEATIKEALEEYILLRKQRRVLGLSGHIGWDPEYEYQEQRRL